MCNKLMQPNGYICDVSMVQTLTLLGKFHYLLDDTRINVSHCGTLISVEVCLIQRFSEHFINQPPTATTVFS